MNTQGRWVCGARVTALSGAWVIIQGEIAFEGPVDLVGGLSRISEAVKAVSDRPVTQLDLDWRVGGVVDVDSYTRQDPL